MTKTKIDKRVIEICNMVAEGITIREVAFNLGVSPGHVFKIVNATPEAKAIYTTAREAAADIFEAEMLDIIRSTKKSTAAADRLKVDTLKWVAARRSPKKYSERIQQDHTNNGQSFTETPTRIELVSPTSVPQDVPWAHLAPSSKPDGGI